MFRHFWLFCTWKKTFTVRFYFALNFLKGLSIQQPSEANHVLKKIKVTWSAEQSNLHQQLYDESTAVLSAMNMHVDRHHNFSA
jgi:hypothetical protein